jgi:hypothetical protein
MSQLRIPIITHPFTCASYYPFEVIHLDHIGPLTADAHGNKFILVLIDAFSRWVELFPTKTTTALESASCISVALVHLRSFIQTEAQPSTTSSSQSCFGLQAQSNRSRQPTPRRRTP